MDMVGVLGICHQGLVLLGTSAAMSDEGPGSGDRQTEQNLVVVHSVLSPYRLIEYCSSLEYSF